MNSLVRLIGLRGQVTVRCEVCSYTGQHNTQRRGKIMRAMNGLRTHVYLLYLTVYSERRTIFGPVNVCLSRFSLEDRQIARQESLLEPIVAKH
jgi:hypothetical protein